LSVIDQRSQDIKSTSKTNYEAKYYRLKAEIEDCENIQDNYEEEQARLKKAYNDKLVAITENAKKQEEALKAAKSKQIEIESKKKDVR